MGSEGNSLFGSSKMNIAYVPSLESLFGINEGCCCGAGSNINIAPSVGAGFDLLT